MNMNHVMTLLYTLLLLAFLAVSVGVVYLLYTSGLNETMSSILLFIWVTFGVSLIKKVS